MSFNQLNIIEPIIKALESKGYTDPTPIQAQAIPVILEGNDLLGSAQTGTGKTAAFAIPVLQRLCTNKTANQKPRPIRALILTPTRELAVQVEESFKAYGKHTGLYHTVVFGGVPQRKQTDALRKGVDILVATPGRLQDLMNQKYINLDKVELFVLDEADRMLDMGFMKDLKRIIPKLPAERQTLFFSATMPPEIQDLANSILNNPVRVSVTPVSMAADTVKQAIYFVDKEDKRELLSHLLEDQSMDRVLVFTRTKRGAEKVVKDLQKADIFADAIHGDKSQGARQRALNQFKSGRIRVLVATDIAARGIDVDSLAWVINYDLPNEAESYIHRIGRTGRAGTNGVALSFCDREEFGFFRDITRLLKKDIDVVEDHPFPGEKPRARKQDDNGGGQKRSFGGGGRRNFGGGGNRRGGGNFRGNGGNNGGGERNFRSNNRGERGESNNREDGNKGERNSSNRRERTFSSNRERGSFNKEKDSSNNRERGSFNNDSSNNRERGSFNNDSSNNRERGSFNKEKDSSNNKERSFSNNRERGNSGNREKRPFNNGNSSSKPSTNSSDKPKSRGNFGNKMKGFGDKGRTDFSY